MDGESAIPSPGGAGVMGVMGVMGVIGIDGGGTKTDGVLVGVDGRVIARRRSGPANWQSVGLIAATAALDDVIGGLLSDAGAAGLSLGAMALGLSGHDRPADDRVLRPALQGIWGLDAPLILTNDTDLILRAGAPGGEGVAVVSGTGSNCVAMGPGGRINIGGLGYEFGDGGSAGEIGTDALRAAFRGMDGRGPKTALSAAVVAFLGISHLNETVDHLMADAKDPLEIGDLAPLVFQLATEGDAVCIGILEVAGRELGLSAVRAAERALPGRSHWPLVLGGSVLQKGASDVMRITLIARVQLDFPTIQAQALTAAPVAGAALLALDGLGIAMTPTIEARVLRALPDQGITA